MGKYKENAKELTTKECKKRGIPTLVWMTPILPFINDTAENIRGLLEYCLQAEVKGIMFWGMGVTLRDGDREYFYHALDQKFPGLRQKYIHTYGNAYELPSPHTEELTQMIWNKCREHGIMCMPEKCFSYLHQYPEKYVQQSLFMS